MTINQAKKLNGFHTRRRKSAERTYVPVNGHLPPGEVLRAIGTPEDIVAQVQSFHDLAVKEREYARKAAAARAAAENAAAAYQREVRETIAADGDPSAVKDLTPKHKATAAAHAQFSADARAQRERLGHALGPQLEAIAPTLFDAAEAEAEKSAAVLREALAGIRATWAAYSAAFQLRVWLSRIALDGGQTAAYHGSTGLPQAVAESLDALEHQATEVDRLKADEQQVAEYREANR